MRRKTPYALLLVLILCISACNNKSNKKESKEILSTDSVDSVDVQQIQESKTEKMVQLNGKLFHMILHQKANDSLPQVKTEAGDSFLDNEISLRITLNKGSLVFNKTFTKKSFSSIVPENFLSHAILEGMVFDRITSDGFVFAASVCYPQTDLYYPITIKITQEGSMSMAKEEQMEETYTEDKD